MNKEFFEKELSSLIEESQTPGVELVELENSSVKVAKDKARYFDNLAALYYSMVEHQLTDKDYGKVDYAAYVFDLLKNKANKQDLQTPTLEKKPVPINEEIQNIIKSNNRITRKITNLQRTYNIINSRYEALTYQKNRLAQMQLFNEVSWQIRVDDINEDLNKFGESRDYLIDDIAKNANEINQKLASIVSAQMSIIEASQESDYLAKNGKIVPHELIDEYEALLDLLNLCNQTITTGSVSIVSGIICVPTSDISKVEDLFMKTNLFANQEMKKANDLVISEIKKEQLRLVRRRRGESKPSRSIKNGEKTYRVLEEDAEEYTTLLSIIEILDKANNSKELKVKVGTMYVLDSDADTLITLMGSTKFYKDLKLNKEVLAPKKEELAKPKTERKQKSPAKPRARKTTSKKAPTKKVEEPKEVVAEKNADAVKQLERQIDNLATGISTYKGTTNLPIAITKPVLNLAPTNGEVKEKDTKVWVVPQGCLPHCNYLVEAINMLNRAQGTNLEPVGKFGYILPQDKTRFQALARVTNGFSGIFPEIPENAKKQAEILRQVAGLIAVAKQTQKTNPNIKINATAKVLEEDMATYNRLKELYQMLENAKFSTDLVPVNGVLVASNETDKYLQLDNKSNIVVEEKQINPDLNVDEINNLMSLCQTLVEAASSHPESEVQYVGEYRVLKSDVKLFNLLGICGVCLVDASESNNLVSVGDNLYVDANDENKYANARKALANPIFQARLNEIQNQKVVSASDESLSIRDLASTPIKYPSTKSNQTSSPKKETNSSKERVEIPESLLIKYLKQMESEGKVPYSLKDLIAKNQLSQDATNYILIQLYKNKSNGLSNLIQEIETLISESNSNQNSPRVSKPLNTDPNYKGKRISNEEPVPISLNGKREQKVEGQEEVAPRRFSGEEVESIGFGKREKRVLELGPHVEKPKKEITRREPTLKEEPPRVIYQPGQVLEEPIPINQSDLNKPRHFSGEEVPFSSPGKRVLEEPSEIVVPQTPIVPTSTTKQSEEPKEAVIAPPEPKVEIQPVVQETREELQPVITEVIREEQVTSNIVAVNKSNNAKIAELQEEINGLYSDIKSTGASSYSNNTIANRNMSTYLFLKEIIKLLENADDKTSVAYQDVYLNERDISRYKALVEALEEERQERREQALAAKEQVKKEVQTRKPKTNEVINWWKENINSVKLKMVNFALQTIDNLDAELYISSAIHQDFSDATEEERKENFKDYKFGNLMTKVKNYLEQTQKALNEREKTSSLQEKKELKAANASSALPSSSSLSQIGLPTMVDKSSTPSLEETSLIDLIRQNTRSDGTLNEDSMTKALRSVVRPEVFEQNPVTQARKAKQEELLARKEELGRRIQSPDISEREVVQIHASLRQIDTELKELTETQNQGIMQERTRKV